LESTMDYKVKDMALADAGRMKMEWAGRGCRC